MRQHIILTICCLIALSSCGTVRRVRQVQQTTVATASSATDSVKLRSTIEKILRETMRTALDTELSKNIEVLHEVYTKPDSTGVTHLKERTVTSYKSNSQTTFSNVMTIDSTSHISESKDSSSIAGSSVEVVENVESDGVQKTRPGVVRILSWIGVLALLVFVVWSLRKIRNIFI